MPEMMQQKSKPMTPEQALEYLTGCTGDVQASRHEHRMIEMALSILGMTVDQWRAMQAGEPESEGNGADKTDPEDPSKLLTED